jgi:hypothetical protein
LWVPPGVGLLPAQARPQLLGEIDGFLVFIHAVELILNQTFSRYAYAISSAFSGLPTPALQHRKHSQPP